MGLPQTKTDQRALFMKLKKHGALDMRIEALGDEDAVIVIRPEILTLVLEQNVRAAQAALGATSDARPENPVPAATKTPNEAHSAQIITLERTERSSTSRP